ncbi:MAG: DNA primase small subunit domain-containing protein [Promethearchaeota archaeon]
MNLKSSIFLKRLFRAYYQKYKDKIPIVNSYKQREFAFIPWDKEIMIRHIGIESQDNFKDYLIDKDKTPRHLFSSGAIYSQPAMPEMKLKGYQGCDLIIDIDVDHFYTPCKEDHDIWLCKACGKSGKGMIRKCPNCDQLKISTLSWLCDSCLNIAKKEIIKLIHNFLIPDFGITKDQIEVAFSGHRGYHLKVENNKIRNLTSEERRELVDYFTGANLSFEILGLKERSGSIFGFSKKSIGWPSKIILEFEKLLTKPDMVIEHFLIENKFTRNQIISFINSKELLLNNITKYEGRAWSIDGFHDLKQWKKFLNGIIKTIGIEIDEPVTIDVHRLIRYPGSLHGKTGFRVQQIELNQLKDFYPLDENNEKLDPIVFKVGKKITQKLEITEQEVPLTKIKGEEYGPYHKGEKVEIPHHIAVFLLCKEVAKII